MTTTSYSSVPIPLSAPAWRAVSAARVAACPTHRPVPKTRDRSLRGPLSRGPDRPPSLLASWRRSPFRLADDRELHASPQHGLPVIRHKEITRTRRSPSHPRPNAREHVPRLRQRASVRRGVAAAVYSVGNTDVDRVGSHSWRWRSEALPGPSPASQIPVPRPSRGRCGSPREAAAGVPPVPAARGRG
jgi:hypothetical protein